MPRKPAQPKCPKCRTEMEFNTPKLIHICPQCGETLCKVKGAFDEKPKRKSPTVKDRPLGRNPTYTEETATKIVEQITEGKSLRTICSQEGMPSIGTIFVWLGDERYCSFRERYMRAKQEQAEAGFERIMEITEQVLRGQLDPNTARVAIDSIKWQLGKLKPGKYSEKMQVEHDGSLTVEVVRFNQKD